MLAIAYIGGRGSLWGPAVVRGQHDVRRQDPAAFGHTVGRSIGLGFVTRDDGPVDRDWLAGGRIEVEVALERLPATASLRPPYDPANARIHG